MACGVLPVRTILAFKNSMVREGLKHTLSGTRFNVQPEDLETVTGLLDAEPLLFIVDIRLHQAATADYVRDLKARHKHSWVVVLSEEFNLDSMMSMLRAGADGYCLSTAACEVLVKYLDLAMLGEVVFPSGAVLSSLPILGGAGSLQTSLSTGVTESLQAISAGAPVRTLSSREAEILHCLMQGAPNKIIARKLDVAEATVKVHIKAILRKIRVTNRTQAAMWAVAHLPAMSGDDSRIAPR